MIFDRDNWQEIWHSLSRNRLRSLLTAFGVFWGIFMLMVLIASGNGLENGITAGFARMASNSVFMWAMRAGKPYRGLPAGRSIEMTNEDTAALREELPEAELVLPRNRLGGWMGGNNVSRGNRTGAFTVFGDHAEVWQVEPLEMERGRFLNPLDLEERRKVAVIGPRVRDVLFAPGEDPIGESIHIRGVYFQVVGIFRSLDRSERGEQAAESIYVPFTTFQRAFNAHEEVGWYVLLARPGVPGSRVEEGALAVLKERHRVAPDDTRAFGSFNLEEEFNKVQNLFTGINLLVWIVGVGTLAAGVIGVSNIMLIIVRERTKEIGLRRAVGATPLRITGQILLESVTLTSIAGYFGLLAGVGLIEVIRAALARMPADSNRMFANPGVGFETALQGLAVLVVAGLLAGMLPARRALSISPREALHSE